MSTPAPGSGSAGPSSPSASSRGPKKAPAAATSSTTAIASTTRQRRRRGSGAGGGGGGGPVAAVLAPILRAPGPITLGCAMSGPFRGVRELGEERADLLWCVPVIDQRAATVAGV